MQARTGPPTGFATALRNLRKITSRSSGMSRQSPSQPVGREMQRGAQSHPRSSSQRSTQDRARPGQGSPRKQRPRAEEEE